MMEQESGFSTRFLYAVCLLARLFPVHSLVRDADIVIERPVGRHIRADSANAEGQRKRQILFQRFLSNFLTHMVDHQFIVLIGELLADNDKFIPAVSDRNIVFAAVRHDCGRDDLDGSIPIVVAKSVIDVFESVHINKQDQQVLASAFLLIKQGAHQLLKSETVVEPSHGILHIHISEHSVHILKLFFFIQVAHGRDQYIQHLE